MDVSTLKYNEENTFITLSSSVSPEFYIFYPDGRLYKKGNFHDATGDKGTSYSGIIVSKNGLFYILLNNLNYVLNKKDEIVSIMSNDVNEIDEENNIVISYEKENIYSKEYKIKLINFLSKKVIFESKNKILGSKFYYFTLFKNQNK